MLKVTPALATAAQMSPTWDTVKFNQGYVNENQPITVLFLLSESLGLQQE